jgi:hypothetical protein
MDRREVYGLVGGQVGSIRSIACTVLLLGVFVLACTQKPGTELPELSGAGESCAADDDCLNHSCTGWNCSGGECPCAAGWECRRSDNPDPIDALVDPYEDHCYLPCTDDADCPAPWTCHEADRCRYVAPPLEVEIEGPERIHLGEAAHYRAVVVSSDGPIVLWRWHFERSEIGSGEGTKVEGGDEVDHTFAETGSWQVELYVEETLGRAQVASLSHFTEVCTSEVGAACSYAVQCCSPLECSATSQSAGTCQ